VKEIKPERLVGRDVPIDRDVIDALAKITVRAPDGLGDALLATKPDGFEVTLLINGMQFPFADFLRSYARQLESTVAQRARNHAERLVGARRESIELRVARMNRVIDAELDDLFPNTKRNSYDGS